jgi:ubiquinone/menaquinone biosynthesis C-methylase UbiE
MATLIQKVRGALGGRYDRPEAWDMAAVTYDVLQPVGLWLLRALGGFSYQEFAREMVRLADLQPSDHVLDAACGTGYLLPALHAATGDGTHICALDFSARMLGRARRKAVRKGLHGVEFQQGAVEELSQLYGPERFDAVLCCFAFPVFTDPQRVLSEMRAVLKAGGRLLISNIEPERLEKARLRPFWRWAIDRWHLCYYCQDEYESMFEQCGLRPPEFYTYGLTVVIKSRRA